jgi:hypothetical protein
MRARNIKPKLFKNELLGSADPLITILFEGLWCCADREGRLEDRPLRMCAEIFPYRRAVTEKKVAKWISWLDEHGFIDCYEVAGKRYIQIVNFRKHQTPHVNEAPSEIPALTLEHLPPSPGALPTKEGSTSHQAPKHFALNPESGFLNPESSLRELRTSPQEGSRREVETEAAGKESPTSPPGDLLEITTRCRDAYPRGTYAHANWILAERALSKLIDEGIPPAVLEGAARDYAAQQAAMGKVGSQYIRSPEKFYGQEFWRGPFEVPVDLKRDAEIVWPSVRLAISNEIGRRQFGPETRVGKVIAAMGGWHALGQRSTEQVDFAKHEFVKLFAALPAQASAA